MLGRARAIVNGLCYKTCHIFVIILINECSNEGKVNILTLLHHAPRYRTCGFLHMCIVTQAMNTVPPQENADVER